MPVLMLTACGHTIIICSLVMAMTTAGIHKEIWPSRFVLDSWFNAIHTAVTKWFLAADFLMIVALPVLDTHQWSSSSAKHLSIANLLSFEKRDTTFYNSTNCHQKWDDMLIETIQQRVTTYQQMQQYNENWQQTTINNSLWVKQCQLLSLSK